MTESKKRKKESILELATMMDKLTPEQKAHITGFIYGVVEANKKWEREGGAVK